MYNQAYRNFDLLRFMQCIVQVVPAFLRVASTLEFVLQFKFMCTLHSRRVVDLSRVGAFAVSLSSDVLSVVVVRRTLCCTRVRRLTRPSAHAERGVR